MRRVHELCPYSNATRGNIDVVLRVDGTQLGESDASKNKTEDNREQDKTSVGISEAGDSGQTREEIAP